MKRKTDPPRPGPGEQGFKITTRRARPSDIARLIEMSERLYPDYARYPRDLYLNEQHLFPQGQIVAVGSDRVVYGWAATLRLTDEMTLRDHDWDGITAHGWFTTHVPDGDVLYAAEVQVYPGMQGKGIGKKLYAARRRLAKRLGVHIIRAGGRMRDYAKHADTLNPQQYCEKVQAGELIDRTLTFQLKQGFRIVKVMPQYTHDDPESLGYGALIEWRDDKAQKISAET